MYGMTFLILLFTFSHAFAEPGVTGKVESVPGCSKKVMVWLSLDKEEYQKRLLLMHTEVPVGGKFQFYLRPGEYQLRATDDKGCEFFQRVKIGRNLASIPVRMKK